MPGRGHAATASRAFIASQLAEALLHRAARLAYERQDSTNYDYALPAMARYLCAEGAGRDLRGAFFAYKHADWYVAEVVELAATFGGIGASATGGGLVNGWADRPALEPTCCATWPRSASASVR